MTTFWEYVDELASPDAEIRKRAVSRLRYTRSKAGMEATVRALDDQDPGVQSTAAFVLADRKGWVEAIPKLISVLKSSPSARTAVLFALSAMKATDATEDVIELLSSGDERTRGWAARALGNIGDPRAFQPLVQALKRAETPEDREPIWYAIGKIGCADKVRHLTHLMETPNWTVRPEDRRVLLEPPEKPARRLSPKEIAKMRADIAELASADAKARDRAITRLGRRRGQVMEFLAEATASPNIEIRFGALFALEWIGDRRAYPVILELTKDPVDDLRWWALDILGRIGGERAIPRLIEALYDEADVFGHSGAADGLVAVGKPAVPAIIRAMENGDDDTRMRASRVLYQIGDEQAIPHVAKLLKDPNPWVRIAGIESLEGLAEEKPEAIRQECIKLIEPTLEDLDEEVRKSAKYSIENIRNPDASG